MDQAAAYTQLPAALMAGTAVMMRMPSGEHSVQNSFIKWFDERAFMSSRLLCASMICLQHFGHVCI